ncbi:cyclic AMP-responsive element-binding protein 3-like protein 3-A [Danio rerio]|uniref:Cyclic AMP-responsive element-binding protein 3-like protein 3-B n=1 Tax=Danio rerio TaxID=7955 RepID=CR3LB_DANRE|nr:cyclic AMP-responsive element-binding protein 3-like protein 3-A [Danio rerio]Q1LYG4.2 RecName: Full=Cyclic AMP-responsive element-binding protein 3-like protein 3-B; Short=cAMP-responsive element-binding protein 3-like protein 3-B; Contains: RecName: Full=Processed cyclic AMP-responsive element-binding protein 3-like protein 3-B [Danio rerio]
MDHYSDQGGDGIELLDLLFDKNDGILRYENMGQQNNQLWPVQDPHMMMTPQGNEDFFNALIGGSDSVSGSPVWSPSPSDSGISEDPHSDHIDSPPPNASPPMEPHIVVSQTQHSLNINFPFDFNGWETGFLPDQSGGTQCASETPQAQQTTGFPLTVKDLLLSGTPEPAAKVSQQSYQELILTEDEKRLLAKEGMTLPNQFPLTKYEERILKKIRRKIRNKQSAQESRKKKKEYIDGLESRMAACSAHNHELQRKVFQLEKCNISLMEQLRRLQALVMNGSNKPVQAGTCVLVLLLSFTLILLPNLKPFTDTKVSQHGDFSPMRVQSRSLHNLQSSRVLRNLDHPYSMTENAKILPRFPEDKTMEEIASLLGRLHRRPQFTEYDPESHNHSFDQHDEHHHGDPITGHVATVTLNPRRGSRRSPHADDM